MPNHEEPIDRAQREQIEGHLWRAIDAMGASLQRPDPRIWAHLLVYCPKEKALKVIEITQEDALQR